MKPASEITVGLALVAIIGNLVMSYAIGLAASAPGWAVMLCVLLVNIWVRLMQIADLMQAKRKEGE